jgi:hypothetical protein
MSYIGWLILENLIIMQHGSDSGTYDKEGRFLPQAFEDMFSKWDRDEDGMLSAWELWCLIAGNRLALDPFGVSFVLWILLMLTGIITCNLMADAAHGLLDN